MTTAVKPNGDASPAATFWTYLTSFTSVNLLTHAEGPQPGKPARAIRVIGAGSGGLVVVKANNTTETLAGLFAGFEITGEIQSITSGTIASAIILW